MLTFFAILNGLLLLMTLLPVSRNESYLVRAFEFPRLQIGIISLVSLIGQGFTIGVSGAASGLVALAALTSLAIQGWWIAPYTRLKRCEVMQATERRADDSLRIVTSNVLQKNQRYDDFLQMVQAAAPDILIAMEANERWQQHLDVLEERGYAHTIKCPLENRYGMLIYSKLPLSDTSTEFLVEQEIPSMHAVVELPSGKCIRMHFVHPSPPSPTENEESTERDAELVIIGKSVRNSDLPVIVTGDLNDVAWSMSTRLFRKISGLLDPRIGRGLFSSYHAHIPVMRWPLDHLFHSDGFSVNEIRRLGKVGSDHFPILIDLQFEGTSAGNGNELEMDHDELRHAEEKMKSKGVAAADVPNPGDPQ